MFSALATFFFQTSEHESKLQIVGLAFTCGLGVATALEGFLGFCLGCYIFGWLIKFKLVPNTIYMAYTNSRSEIDYTYNYMNERLGEGVPRDCVYRFDEKHSTQIDYKYK
jgi:hypothetical protein